MYCTILFNLSININTKLQKHNELNSLVIHLNNNSYLSVLSKHVIETIVSSPMSSPNGIHVTIERPYMSKGELNIFRPSVLRQYFGLNYATQANVIERYSYGTGAGVNSVGIDSTNFMTRIFTDEMKELSTELYDMLVMNKDYLGLNTVDLSIPFNHCTVLLYYACDGIKKIHTLVIIVTVHTLSMMGNLYHRQIAKSKIQPQ